jgi:hypothetical protein
MIKKKRAEQDGTEETHAEEKTGRNPRLFSLPGGGRVELVQGQERVGLVGGGGEASAGWRRGEGNPGVTPPGWDGLGLLPGLRRLGRTPCVPGRKSSPRNTEMAGHHLFPFNRASDWVKRVVCNRFVGFRRAIDSPARFGKNGGPFFLP